MALPKLNQNSDFQKQSINNQSEMSGGINNVASQLNNQTKILGRVENWLDQTYELHKEYYDLQREDRREAARARKKMQGGAASMGSGKTTSGDGGGFALPILAGLGVGALASKISEYFKGLNKSVLKDANKTSATSKKNAKKVNNAADDLKKGAKKVNTAADDLKRGSAKINTAADNLTKKVTKFKLDPIKGLVKVNDDIIKVAGKTDDLARAGKLGVAFQAATQASDAGGVAKWLSTSTTGKIISKAFSFATVVEGVAVNVKDAYDVGSAVLDEDIRTKVQSEDLGGVIGGAIGGALGLVFGGPAGGFLGLSLGNWVGENIGKMFDSEFSQEFLLEQDELTKEIARVQRSIKLLNEQKSQMSDAEYEAQMAALKTQEDILASQSSSMLQISELKKIADEKGENYNKFKSEIGDIDSATEQELEKLRSLKSSYDKAFDTFNKAAGIIIDPAQKLIDAGIIKDIFLTKNKIDKSRLGEVSDLELSQLLEGGTLMPESNRAIIEEGKRRGLTLTQSKLRQPTGPSTASVFGLDGESAPIASAAATFSMSSYMQSVGQRESGGFINKKTGKVDPYQAIGGSGNLYLGKYQMGSAALETVGYLKAGSSKGNPAAWKDPKNWTRGLSGYQDFLNSPEIQDLAMKKYTAVNKRTLMNRNVLSEYSSPARVAGFLAAAHLLGAKTVATKGIEGVDGNNVKGTEYFNIGAASQGGFSMAPAGGGSASGGRAGAAVLEVSMGQATRGAGGGNVVDNSTVVTDNSVNQASSTNVSLPARASNNSPPQVRPDPVRDGFYL